MAFDALWERWFEIFMWKVVSFDYVNCWLSNSCILQSFIDVREQFGHVILILGSSESYLITNMLLSLWIAAGLLPDFLMCGEALFVFFDGCLV